MKWTKEISQSELKPKKAIDKIGDHRITPIATVVELAMSERQLRRILHSYREKGVEWIVSVRRGRPGNRRLPEKVDEKIGPFITQPRLVGFGPTFWN